MDSKKEDEGKSNATTPPNETPPASPLPPLPEAAENAVEAEEDQGQPDDPQQESSKKPLEEEDEDEPEKDDNTAAGILNNKELFRNAAKNFGKQTGLTDAVKTVKEEIAEKGLKQTVKDTCNRIFAPDDTVTPDKVIKETQQSATEHSPDTTQKEPEEKTTEKEKTADATKNTGATPATDDNAKELGSDLASNISGKLGGH